MEEHLEEVKQETYITLSFIKLLYFSVATMTGTGVSWSCLELHLEYITML
jgi:hypothetical protein